MLRSSTWISNILEYIILDGILPDNVMMHKYYNKNKHKLLESITTLFLSDDLEDQDNENL